MVTVEDLTHPLDTVTTAIDPKEEEEEGVITEVIRNLSHNLSYRPFG